jgi:hypothetical protein
MVGASLMRWPARSADESLVDMESGTPVRWVEGQAWIEEIIAAHRQF